MRKTKQILKGAGGIFFYFFVQLHLIRLVLKKIIFEFLVVNRIHAILFFLKLRSRVNFLFFEPPFEVY